MSKNEMFEEYFKKYRDLLIRAVMSKTGDYQAAQEICQQVFCTYYCHMDEIEAELVKAWLLKCTHHAIVDHLRKSGLRREVAYIGDYQEKGSALPETEIDYCENRVINTDLTGRILRSVREVNEAWYEVLIMICVEGMSHKQAAKKLNVSEQVLRARLYRARNYVREKFGDEYWDR